MMPQCGAKVIRNFGNIRSPGIAVRPLLDPTEKLLARVSKANPKPTIFADLLQNSSSYALSRRAFLKRFLKAFPPLKFLSCQKTKPEVYLNV
jgi:hypothetical protein